MKPEKILIIQTAFLGDAVLTLPMIQFLKNKFGGAAVDVVAIPSTAEVFEASPSVDDVIIYDKRGNAKTLAGLVRLAAKIKKRNYDRIYSPHRSLRSSLIVKLSGVKETFGFDTSAGSLLYKNKIRYDSSAHEVLRNLRLAGFEDNTGEDWKIPPVVETGIDADKKIASEIKSLTEKKIIAVAPGSVWNTKVYPIEYFEKISSALIAKGYFLIFLGGGSDAGICSGLEKKFSGNSKSFAGSFSIRETVSALRRCNLIISNDSAPTHLGMAAGIPVLTIYCSTVPFFGFYPYINSSFISYDDLDCKPCGIHGHNSCPVKTFDCAYKLLPEAVLKQIESML